jgi:hypothetical protein
LNGIYGGLGQSLGSLIGGEMSKNLGIQKAFYICGAVDMVILVLFAVHQMIVYKGVDPMDVPTIVSSNHVDNITSAESNDLDRMRV